MSRYARQTMLPEIGPAGQATLKRAHVLVIGTGGLAAPALQYLVGAGIGSLSLVDGDRVSLSNLHRQTLFREDDLGRAKVDVAAQTLRGLNSDVQIRPLCTSLNPQNAPELIENADIVLDCADGFAVSYTLSDICHDRGVPLISASVLGAVGYVGGFCGAAPSLRAVFPDLPDRAATCATAGVMGPVVGMIGAAQAQMVLGVLLGQSPSPLGQILSFDMNTLRNSGFRFDTAPEPVADFTFISADQITQADFVIELRGTDEAPIQVAPHAQRQSLSQMRSINPTPDTGQRAVLACRSGLRAWQAATHLRSYWNGEIQLIAMGDTPPPTKEEK
ncbi:HesA/MoeB/ThiF family protein [Amylibacter marinus]|nr:HesA/MoeB/ThiF family protein [Amylibacter marinus]